MRNYRPSILCLLLLLAAPVYAQQAQRQETPSAPGEVAAVSALPASDAVFVFNIERLLTDALPRVLPADGAKYIDSYLTVAKFLFGMDLREVASVVVGMKLPKTISARTMPSFVVILRGSFNAEKEVADLRRLLQGESPQAIREERYKGRTVFIFNLGAPDPPSEKSLLDVVEVSITVMDSGMFAVGQLADVKRTIDAGEGYGRISPALAKLATLNPKALVTVATVAPEEKEEPSVVSVAAQIEDDLFEILASVADSSASLELNDAALELSLLAHTRQDDKALPLRDLLLSLVHQLSAVVKDTHIKEALDSLQAESHANEVRLKLRLPRKVVAEYVSAWKPWPMGMEELPLIKPQIEPSTPGRRGPRKRRRARRR